MFNQGKFVKLNVYLVKLVKQISTWSN